MANYITRTAEALVRRYSAAFRVVVVTGPRQVGKTTMLRHLMEEDAQAGHPRSYVTLDNTADLRLARQDPALFMQRYKPPVLIDEIQRAPELLPEIKLLVDASDAMGSVWLTGSQPFHLMKNVSETLAGRAALIELQGLSNSEIAGIPSEPFLPSREYFLRRTEAAPAHDVGEVYQRIVAGSFPGITAFDPDLRQEAYESFISTYLMRDVRDLTQISDELTFRRFMEACAALTSKPVVYAELARICDIDAKTARAWLSILGASYLVKVVPPYANNLLKRLSKQPIMHFMDTGLAAYLIGWDNPKALEVSAMSGPLFESYVFGEIYKSYLYAGKRPPLWFFRTHDKREIDILLENEGVLYPIEVKKTASPTMSDTRNFAALAPAARDDAPSELAAFKREIGLGSVVCMTSTALPITEHTWAMPAWAI